MEWEQIKVILECITSICFLIGVIKGVLFFGYKNDESIRTLYIDHARKLNLLFHNFFAKGNINEDDRRLLFDLVDNAVLFLHRDIVDYINEIKELIFQNELIACELINLPIGEERNQKCHLQAETKLKLDELYKKRLNKYRKHIVKEVFKSSKDK